MKFTDGDTAITKVTAVDKVRYQCTDFFFNKVIIEIYIIIIIIKCHLQFVLKYKPEQKNPSR